MDASVRHIYDTVPEADRNPGVHLMTGPIYVEDAKPGDMLEVRYLRMVPRFDYGSNLAANWGHLYKEFGEKERVTIYKIDRSTNLAEAHYAYDYPGLYETPGKITNCPECDRQRALNGVRVPIRPHLGTAGVAPDAPGRVSTIPPGAHGGNIGDVEHQRLAGQPLAGHRRGKIRQRTGAARHAKHMRPRPRQGRGRPKPDARGGPGHEGAFAMKCKIG